MSVDTSYDCIHVIVVDMTIMWIVNFFIMNWWKNYNRFFIMNWLFWHSSDVFIQTHIETIYKLKKIFISTELEFNYNKQVRISHIYFHLFKQHEYFITCIYVYMYIVFETATRNQPLRILRMWAHALFLQRNQEGDTRKLRSTYNISNNFLYLIPCRY